MNNSEGQIPWIDFIKFKLYPFISPLYRFITSWAQRGFPLSICSGLLRSDATYSSAFPAVVNFIFSIAMIGGVFLIEYSCLRNSELDLIAPKGGISYSFSFIFWDISRYRGFFVTKEVMQIFCSFGYKLRPLRIRRVINRIMYLESVSWKPRSKDWNLLLEAAIWYKDILLTLWRFELALTQTTITCLRRLWAGRTNV